MRHTSPLRYPGGKAELTGFLTDVIDLNDLRGCPYYEPYAGGAGAAIGLLKHGVVSEIFLNDADRRVYAFWRAILQNSERFVERIHTVPLSIKEWYRQHKICARPRSHAQFDLGFSAFYMNRCNRSGVLSGAGPIGGYEQSGKWRMDVRFNRETLARRILNLSRMKTQIHVTCEDAIVFLKKQLPRGRGRNRVFVYLDPPYVNNGQRLYLNAYQQDDHAKLSRYLDDQTVLPWIMSYDDSSLVRELYVKQQIALMPIRYTLQEKRSAHELIISPCHVAIPNACRIYGRENLLQVSHHQGGAS
ncbi:MAG: DNA adenine methylase [Gammaproteobacteria bacterium]|nr:MAG: DNA adenine methylase [Gammaproteobacteria bacterium]